MSNETKIYGYIEVPVWSGIDIDSAIELNWSAINSLPDEGEWPWLIKGMFALAPDRVGYRGRMFHFAAAIKGVDEEWNEWLNKFESLLKKMYWFSAELQLKTEYAGNHEFSWVAEIPDTMTPISNWEFFGEHRNFDHVYKK